MGEKPPRHTMTTAIILRFIVQEDIQTQTDKQTNKHRISHIFIPWEELKAENSARILKH